MTRRTLVVGNWKMNTSRTEAVTLATQLRDGPFLPDVDLAVCPPFPWLEVVGRTLSGSPVHLGAQDCWHEQSGAFTGQVSPAMIAELCSFVLLGHSEHRRDAGESNELVGLKAVAALEAGITPIICVGEALEPRQAGEATRWVGEQITAVTEVVGSDRLTRCAFAYEPIWAIGTGVSAGPRDVQEKAAFIRGVLRGVSADGAGEARILYGGSVTADNAGVLVQGDDVDGLLVGGASLSAQSFLQIAAAC